MNQSMKAMVVRTNAPCIIILAMTSSGSCCGGKNTCCIVVVVLSLITYYEQSTYSVAKVQTKKARRKHFPVG